MLVKLQASSKNWNTSQETTVLVANMANWAFILRIIKLKACLFILKLPKVSLTPWNRVMLWAQNKSKLKTNNTIQMIIDARILLFSRTLPKTRKTLKNLKRNIVKATRAHKNKSLYQMLNLLYNNSYLIQLPWGILWIVIVKRRSLVQYLILVDSLQNRSRFKLKDIVLTKSTKEFQPRTLLLHRTARTTKKLQLPIANMDRI